MAAVAKCNSKRMYSWWWDSHNTPKNSKWLQDNLADMDSNVKQMIKVLEEDADSFARRAEMYYRKRPELMQLVEEFYRAYRALAERYNHATAVIHEAHQTMAEAFPNQVPLIYGDESHDGALINDDDPQTPEMHPPLRARVDPDELHTGALGVSSSHVHAVKRNRALSEEPSFVSNGKSSKHMVGSEIGKVRKGLKFDDGDGKGRNDSSNGNHDLKAQILSESERASKAEAEVVALRDALSKMQAEKEASLAQVEKNLERLTILESEISCAQEKSGELKERATNAEAEIQTLKETLKTLESEKEASLVQYQQCLQKIADLEDGISVSHKEASEINERASRAEAETLALKQSLAKAEIDKEAALCQHRQCLETISYLEEKLQKAEDDARLINEQAEKARNEVENLKQTISKLIEDKETSELKYRQYLDIIADLKLKLFHAQEETQRLGREIEDGVARLKFSEEKCLVLERSNQNLHSELDGLLGKLGNQSQELTEKQTELVRLWSCVQEEHLRFQEAETAFQTLQKLHSQSQEELNNLTVELQTRSQIMKDMEIRSKGLHEEVQQAKVENKSLNEINLSSAASIRSLQDGVSSLKKTIQKLEEEVELRVNQRNALQQEIYCLKEELSQIGKKHQSIVEQVESVGLHPNCFGSSVKELQEENSKLKEFNQREKTEKMALLEKLEIMETLVQKNLVLENSISELNSEVEAIRGKLKIMEETCQLLSEDKSGLIAENEVLISRLQTATENSEILSMKNKLLENSLCNADAELKDLRINLKRLEDSCRLLNDSKSSLTSEREIVLSHMDKMRKGLDDLGKEHSLLRSQVAELVSERESSLQKIKELGTVHLLQDENQDKMQNMLLMIQDENQQTAIENIVLVELLRQFNFEAIGIAAEKKILKDQLSQKEKKLREAMVMISIGQNQKSKLCKELEEIKVEKEKLNQELHKEKREAEMWESQAATFFCDMQTSSIHETLIKALTHELAEAYKNLESRNASKDVNIKQLKGRVNSLEDANKGKYAQAIVLLNASIQSLEEHVAVHCKSGVNLTKSTDLKDNAKVYAVSDDRFSELEDMRLRIKAIAEAVMEKEKVVMLENSNAYSMLEAALKQIKELKTGTGRRSTRKQEGESGKLRKQSHESEMITKDIVLDQTSDGSSYEIINKKGNLELDDLSIELKPLKIHKAITTKDSDDAVKVKGKSEESLVVDKLEIFDTSMDPNREVSKRKFVERLESDLQKLDNLQITIDDLKSKAGRDEKDMKGDEYETIRGQLKEAEEALEKLLNVNRKLTAKARSSFRSSSGNSPLNLDETESNRRRRTTEQARRGSEKIGRLQLEIQRIQFVLMKLEGERENRARSKISDTNLKVPLRDYIYGVSRSVSMKKTRKKRSAFCACVQPPPSP